MNLPGPLQAALQSLRRAGGRPLLAGGCVRDWLLGLEPKDFDIEVFGLDFERMRRALAPFGPTDVVGRSFGVLKVRLEGIEHDFSLPRRESKTGAGHRGFAVAPEPGLTEAEAAARRDFTINAIAYDPAADCVIDPHGGRADLERRVLRHTSPAFRDDPLRVLRGFQLAGRFQLTIHPATARECQAIRDSFRELPVERVWGEWDKWATKSARPGMGLVALRETGWLVHFPEVAALDGLPQDPDWHPEGDVFTHTRHCLDALAQLAAWREAGEPLRRLLSFAVLAHDFGKATTTQRAERHGTVRWISPGHEAAGVPLAEAFLRRIGAPHDLAPHVGPLVATHLAHQHGQADFTDTMVRRLARRLAPATVDQLLTVMEADHLGRPPLTSAETVARIGQLRAGAARLALKEAAPRPLLLGRHLVAAGLAPGPRFTPILETAFEAQLDGAFLDEAGAVAWLENRLRAEPPATN